MPTYKRIKQKELYVKYLYLKTLGLLWIFLYKKKIKQNVFIFVQS